MSPIAKFSQKEFLWLSAFLIITIGIMYRPLLCMWLFLASSSIYFSYANKTNKSIFLSALVFGLIIYTPYFSTKTSYFSFGNDKYMYVEFMRHLLSSDFFNAVIDQPEILSFLLLKLSAELFGISNFAFAFMFVISLALLIVSTYSISPKVAVAFFALFLASSVSFNILGNTIRQGLAIGFIFLALSCANRVTFSAAAAAAAFSHFSAFFIIPFLFCKKIIIKLSSTHIIIVCLAAYGIGLLLPTVLYTITFSWGYLEKKKDLYIDYDGTETGFAIFTFIISLILTILTKLSITERFIPKSSATEKNDHGQATLFSATIYTGLILLLSMQSLQIFSRMYLYYLPIFMLYLLIYISNRKSTNIRITATLMLMTYATYSFFKNISDLQWFYCGNSSSYISASIFHIGSCY